MASLFDTTIGQQTEWLRVLASAGFTDADIRRIIEQPYLAAAMYEVIKLWPTELQTPIPSDTVARLERQLKCYEAFGIVIESSSSPRTLFP